MGITTLQNYCMILKLIIREFYQTQQSDCIKIINILCRPKEVKTKEENISKHFQQKKLQTSNYLSVRVETLHKLRLKHLSCAQKEQSFLCYRPCGSTCQHRAQFVAHSCHRGTRCGNCDRYLAGTEHDFVYHLLKEKQLHFRF